MAINLEPVSRKAVLQIWGLFWDPEPPPPPNPLHPSHARSLSHFFMYIFSPGGANRKNPWWPTRVGVAQVLLKKPGARLWGGGVRGSLGPWRREWRAGCHRVLRLCWEAEPGSEGGCAELIEFVLPALTPGPVAYQATSPRAPLERSAPTRASDITITPPADVHPCPLLPPLLYIFPIWSWHSSMRLANGKNSVFLASCGLESEKDSKTCNPVETVVHWSTAQQRRTLFFWPEQETLSVGILTNWLN